MNELLIFFVLVFVLVHENNTATQFGDMLSPVKEALKSMVALFHAISGLVQEQLGGLSDRLPSGDLVVLRHKQVIGGIRKGIWA